MEPVQHFGNGLTQLLCSAGLCKDTNKTVCGLNINIRIFNIELNT